LIWCIYYVISTNKVGVFYCVTIPVMGRVLIMGQVCKIKYFIDTHILRMYVSHFKVLPKNLKIVLL